MIDNLVITTREELINEKMEKISNKRSTLFVEIKNLKYNIKRVILFLEENKIDYNDVSFLGNEKYPSYYYDNRTAWSNFLIIKRNFKLKSFITFRKYLEISLVDINNGFIYDPIKNIDDYYNKQIWKIKELDISKFENKFLEKIRDDLNNKLKELEELIK